MRAVELGKVAAAAEAQRLQYMGLRYAQRIAFLVVAAVFGFFALASLHVLLWVLCYGPWNVGKVWASVIVLAFDVVAAGIFVLVGRGKQPGAAEIEARMTRDRNLAAMRNAFALSAVTATVVGPVGRTAGRGILNMFRSKKHTRRSGYRSR
jgi:hypothetical protein